MAKKITKKENFGAIKEILEGLGRTDLVAVMTHEIELLDKKSASGKMTKTQEANLGIKELILTELKRIGHPISITELLKASPELYNAVGGSNQRTSALMTQMLEKNGGTVVRTQDKKTALFSVAQEVDITD